MAYLWYYYNIKIDGSDRMIETIIQLYTDNLLYAAIGTIIALFIIFRLLKTAKIYLGTKSYVRKSKKLRKKKYNGIQLTDKIKKKRKKNTNEYSKLRGRGKKLVRKYFNYKIEELPVITRFSYGKLFKRSKKKFIIVVKNERKTLKKVNMRKGLKNLIQITNKFKCLDELIHFLHNLPEAILEQQDYDIYIGDEGISIGYIVK